MSSPDDEWPASDPDDYESDCTSQTSTDGDKDDDPDTPQEREDGEITDTDEERQDETEMQHETTPQIQNIEKRPTSIQITPETTPTVKTTRTVSEQGKKILVSIPTNKNLIKQGEKVNNFIIYDTVNLIQTPREIVETPKFEIPNLYCEWCKQSTHHHEDERKILRCKHCRFRYSTIPEYEAYLKIKRKENLKVLSNSQVPKRKRKPRTRKMKKMAF